MEKINIIGWNTKQLWKGCILAGIAHAIMVAHYPDIANEHSWDGLNYSVQDSMGQRGTVSFKNEYVVAAFRNDNSQRMSKALEAAKFFQGASEKMISLANSEALQYLLDEVDGNTVPLITTAFWGENDLYSNDTVEDMLYSGANLLSNQFLQYEQAIGAWVNYYDMGKDQVDLLRAIYDRKINCNHQLILLTKEEIGLIGSDDEEGLEESRISFEEMGIKK